MLSLFLQQAKRGDRGVARGSDMLLGAGERTIASSKQSMHCLQIAITFTLLLLSAQYNNSMRRCVVGMCAAAVCFSFYYIARLRRL